VLGLISPHNQNSPKKHLPELHIQRRKPEVCSNGSTVHHKLTSVNFRQPGLRGRLRADSKPPANGLTKWVQTNQGREDEFKTSLERGKTFWRSLLVTLGIGVYSGTY